MTDKIPSCGDFISIQCPNCDTDICFVVPSPLPEEIDLICSGCMGLWTLVAYDHPKPSHLQLVKSGGAL